MDCLLYSEEVGAVRLLLVVGTNRVLEFGEGVVILLLQEDVLMLTKGEGDRDDREVDKLVDVQGSGEGQGG